MAQTIVTITSSIFTGTALSIYHKAIYQNGVINLPEWHAEFFALLAHSVWTASTQIILFLTCTTQLEVLPITLLRSIWQAKAAL